MTAVCVAPLILHANSERICCMASRHTRRQYVCGALHGRAGTSVNCRSWLFGETSSRLLIKRCCWQVGGVRMKRVYLFADPLFPLENATVSELG